MEKMKKRFQVGQQVVWNCVEPFNRERIKAVITEVFEDYAIAVTVGNKNPANDDLHLLIDADTEMDFF